MIHRHLGAKEKHSLDVEGVYNMQLHAKNNFNSILKATLIPILKICYIFFCIKIMYRKFYSFKRNTFQKKLVFYEIFVYRILIP